MTYRVVITVALAVFTSSDAEAQISVSFSRQGNLVTGGIFRIGGPAVIGGTHVRMGINASTSQLIGVQTFPFAQFGNGFGNGGNGFGGQATNNPANRLPRPTGAQFVKASMTFDKDESGELEEQELEQMAIVVVRELKQRQRMMAGKSPAPVQGADEEQAPSEQEKQQVAAFVKRSLRFDTDKSEGLSRDEMVRMARVFLKTVS